MTTGMYNHHHHHHTNTTNTRNGTMSFYNSTSLQRDSKGMNGTTSTTSSTATATNTTRTVSPLNPRAAKAIPPPPSSQLPKRERSSPKRVSDDSYPKSKTYHHQYGFDYDFQKMNSFHNQDTSKPNNTTSSYSGKSSSNSRKTIATIVNHFNNNHNNGNNNYYNYNRKKNYYNDEHYNQNKNVTMTNRYQQSSQSKIQQKQHQQQQPNDDYSSPFIGSTRKSAIQDVIKKFQCPDTTSIPTTVITNATTTCTRSSTSYNHNNNNNNDTKYTFKNQTSTYRSSPSPPRRQRLHHYHHHDDDDDYDNNMKDNKDPIQINLNNGHTYKYNEKRYSNDKHSLPNTTSLSSSSPTRRQIKESSSPKSSPLKDLFNSQIAVCRGGARHQSNHHQQPPTTMVKCYNNTTSSSSSYNRHDDKNKNESSPNSFAMLYKNPCPFNSSDSNNVIISDRNSKLYNYHDNNDDDENGLIMESLSMEDLASVFRKRSNDNDDDYYCDNDLPRLHSFSLGIEPRRDHDYNNIPNIIHHVKDKDDQNYENGNEQTQARIDSTQQLHDHDRISTTSSIENYTAISSSTASNDLKGKLPSQLLSSPPPPPPPPSSSPHLISESRSRRSRSPISSKRRYSMKRSVSRSPVRSNGPNLLDQLTDVKNPSDESEHQDKVVTITPTSSPKQIERKSTLKVPSKQEISSSNKVNLHSTNGTDINNQVMKKTNLNQNKLLPEKVYGKNENNNHGDNKVASTQKKMDEYRDKAEEYLEQWKRRQVKSSKKAENNIVSSNVAALNAKGFNEEHQTIPVKTLIKQAEKKSNKDTKMDKNQSDLEQKSEHDSTFSLSEKVNLETEIEQLKKQLADSEAKLLKQEATIQEEKERHVKVESKLHEKLEIMTNEQNEKRNKAINSLSLKEDLDKMTEEVRIYKDQLQENDEYIASLEKAMEDQLDEWEQQKGKNQSEMEEKCSEVAQLQTTEIKLKQELSQQKKQISDMKETLREIHDLKNAIVLEKKKTKDLETAAQMNEVKSQRIVNNLQEKNEALTFEIQSLQEKVEKSHSIEKSRDSEISRLKEEIKHAEFRVHVLKTEVREASPKRQREIDSKANESLHDSIADLELQVEMAKNQAKAALDEKEKMQEKMQIIQSEINDRENHFASNIDQSTSLSNCEKERLQDQVKRLEELLASSERQKDDLKEEVAQLEQKLFDARSRSRRIATKSESEMTQMRESEKRLANKVADLETQLDELKSNHSSELSELKRIENALRKELILLRGDTSSLDGKLSSTAMMSSSFSIRLEGALHKLSLAMANLLKKTDDIGSAKDKISRELINQMIKEVGAVRLSVAKVEVSFEEDKVQILETIQALHDNINKSNAQTDSVREKLKEANDEIARCEESKNDAIKKFKLKELELLSNWNSQKGRLVQLQEDFNRFKSKAAEEKARGQDQEKILVEEVRRLESLCNSKPVPREEKKEKKMLSMSLQQSDTVEDVEVRLKDDEDELLEDCNGIKSLKDTNVISTSIDSVELEMKHDDHENFVSENMRVTMEELRDFKVNEATPNHHSEARDELFWVDEIDAASQISV